MYYWLKIKQYTVLFKFIKYYTVTIKIKRDDYERLVNEKIYADFGFNTFMCDNPFDG